MAEPDYTENGIVVPDIVKRLRGSIPGDPDYVLGLISDAADEIERLRTTGDALIAAIRNHDLREERIKAWEAIRS